MNAITKIEYENAQAALNDRLGKGGLFFVSQDGKTTWFPFTVGYDDVLKDVRGSGFIGTWNHVECRTNGPIGGPRSSRR